MADEKDIAAEEGGGGGKKKLIIIIGAVVLLLTVGGAAAFFLLGADGGEGADEGAAEEVAALEEGDPVYHKLDPTFVVNLPPGGSAKMLQIAIEVMTRHAGVVETLQANDPMIRHYLIDLLEQQQAAELMSVDGRKALQASIQTLIGEKLDELQEPGEVQGVFFTQFVMQ